MIITDIREDGLAETLHLLEKGDGEHRMITCDLTIDEDMERMMTFLPVLDGMVKSQDNKTVTSKIYKPGRY